MAPSHQMLAIWAQQFNVPTIDGRGKTRGPVGLHSARIHVYAPIMIASAGIRLRGYSFWTHTL